MGKISSYARVLAAKLADVFVVDQTDNGTTETKSATVEQIGTAIGTLQNFADLDTSNKNLVDAINEIASYTPVYGNTASGAIATFDTSLALPLQDCTIAINAVQESGTPTPSSPKAISGFTGANIHVADDETPHIIDNVTPITWQTEAGTVYGGYFRIVNGFVKLTVTHYGITFDFSSTGEVGGGYRRKSYSLGAYKAKYPPTEENPQICNVATYKASYAEQSTHFYCGEDNCNVILPSDTPTSTSITVVYELKDYLTFDLSPTQISAIVGTNNVFTDTNGNTSVVYACSLKDYIDSQ